MQTNMVCVFALLFLKVDYLLLLLLPLLFALRFAELFPKEDNLLTPILNPVAKVP